MTSYYSPGVCPAEYRSCQPPPATGVQSLSSSDGETIAFCCPTNYDCPYDGSGPFSLCISELSTSTSVIVLNNIYQQQIVSTRSFTVPSGDAYMYEIAYPIQVRYKEGETIPTGAVSSSSSNVGSAVLSQSQSQRSPSDGSSGSKSGGGLSGGAIAGILIGAIAALALVVVAVLLLLLYRKNKSKQVSPSAEGADVVNSAYAGDEKRVGSPPAAPPVALHTKPQVSPNSSQIGVAHAKVAELDTRYTQQFTSPDAHQLDSTFAQPVGYVEMPTQVCSQIRHQNAANRDQQYNPGTNYIAELPSKQ